MQTIDKPMGENRLAGMFASVENLAEQIHGHQKRNKLVLGLSTWVAAVQLFKALRSHVGLPENLVDEYGYGTMIANLKAAGKMFMQCHLVGKIDFSQAELDERTVRSLLDEICGMDRRLENGLLNESLDDVAAAFPSA